MRHTLGNPDDKEIYNEKDDTYEVGITKSKTDKYLMIRCEAKLSTEYRILNANEPYGEFKTFYPRQKALEYSVIHGGDKFYILHNKDAKNFKISETPGNATDIQNWKDVIAQKDDVLIEDLTAMKNFLAIQEKKTGLPQLHILDRRNLKEHYIPFEDPTYTSLLGTNTEFDTPLLRYSYDSLATPASVYDYNMETKTKVLKKRQEVIGGFKPEEYTVERFMAPAQDGTPIPVSVVYKKGLELNGTNPLYITGYGSYGYSYDPEFDSDIFSLVDRGFIFAIPHIRGGSEMGRKWYEDGKFFNKKNTFTDFIAATEYLIRKNYTSPKHIYASGASAGGLLMGAIANIKPEIYNGIIAGVPFVDVVTTMLDESIPLTTGEYDEWGNPNDKKYYEYMLSYSPYDNIKAQQYPNMLVTAGLNDSQVQYWEPAKWTAKLRTVKTDNNLLLLKTDMEVGHSGKSGRFERLKLTALEYSFILYLEKGTADIK